MVREAIFDMLPLSLEKRRVLDLFAGSGAMGIEALSRGAAEAVFVESDPTTSKIIKENLKACGFVGDAKVTGGKLPKTLAGIIKKEGTFDLVFVDPPYEKNLAKKTLAVLERCEGVALGGLVVVEHSMRDEMPDEVSQLKIVKEKAYGSTGITIYEREPEENGQEKDLKEDAGENEAE